MLIVVDPQGKLYDWLLPDAGNETRYVRMLPVLKMLDEYDVLSLRRGPSWSEL